MMSDKFDGKIQAAFGMLESLQIKLAMTDEEFNEFLSDYLKNPAKHIKAAVKSAAEDDHE